MALVEFVAALSWNGGRALAAVAVADRNPSGLGQTGQSHRQRFGTGIATAERATRPPVWRTKMAEEDRETIGIGVGIPPHRSTAKRRTQSGRRFRITPVGG